MALERTGLFTFASESERYQVRPALLFLLFIHLNLFGIISIVCALWAACHSVVILMEGSGQEPRGATSAVAARAGTAPGLPLQVKIGGVFEIALMH
jgi:hypothetical protein